MSRQVNDRLDEGGTWTGIFTFVRELRFQIKTKLTELYSEEFWEPGLAGVAFVRELRFRIDYKAYSLHLGLRGINLPEHRAPES